MKVSKYNIIKNFEGNILVYNSFSKASIILAKDSDVSAFKEIEAFNSLGKAEQQILIDGGFIIEDQRDELSEIKYFYEQKFFDNQSLYLSLVPTLKCNFKCPYCCEKDYTCGPEDPKKYFQTLYQYAKQNFGNYQDIQIMLFGGEPLINIKEFLKFLAWVKKDAQKKKYRFYVSTTTNGSLLTKDIFEQLLTYNLVSLQITIDSDQENHDQNRIFNNGKPSFGLLIAKINALVPLSLNYPDFKFVLRINLNNTTVEKVRKTLEAINQPIREHCHLLIRAIYNTANYQEVNHNSVFALKDYFDLANELGFAIVKDSYKFQTCEACGDRKSIYLMPDLSVWKCINDLSYTACQIGKVNDEGMIDVIPENVVKWYNHCMSAFADEECLKCQMLPECFGGCPLYKAKHQGKKSCRSFEMTALPSIY